MSGFSTWHCYGHPLCHGGSTHQGTQRGLIRKIRMLISIPFKSGWSYSLIMWHLNVGESERHKAVSARVSLTPARVRVYIHAVMWKGMLKISWDDRTYFPSQKQALCDGILQSPLLVLFCSSLLPEKWKSWAVERMRPSWQAVWSLGCRSASLLQETCVSVTAPSPGNWHGWEDSRMPGQAE